MSVVMSPMKKRGERKVPRKCHFGKGNGKTKLIYILPTMDAFFCPVLITDNQSMMCDCVWHLILVSRKFNKLFLIKRNWVFQQLTFFARLHSLSNAPRSNCLHDNTHPHSPLIRLNINFNFLSFSICLCEIRLIPNEFKLYGARFFSVVGLFQQARASVFDLSLHTHFCDCNYCCKRNGFAALAQPQWHSALAQINFFWFSIQLSFDISHDYTEGTAFVIAIDLNCWVPTVQKVNSQ